MPFNIKDIVDTAAGLATQRQGGSIRYRACLAATQGGGKTCDKKACPHPITHYWVLWPGFGTTMSYPEADLVLVKSATSTLTEAKQAEDIAPEDKKVLTDKFAEIEKKDPRPAEPKDWDAYHGFDKRWASKKDYPDKEPLKEEAMTPEWWQKYHYGNNAPIDRRTIR